MKRIATCLIKNSEGDLLFGLRNDNNLWTNAGGHIEDGEDAYVACVRELKEETGLDALCVKLIKAKYISKKKLFVYVFEVEVDDTQEVDPSKDPDKECDIWLYLNPNSIKDKLHVPIESNVLLEAWMEDT